MEADLRFREETRALVHRRVRFGIFLGIGFFVLVAPLDWALGANVPVSLACRTIAILALLALLAVARLPVALARPEWLAAGVMTVLGGSIAWLLSRSAGPGDPWAALHAGGLVLLALGTGSLLPVGAGFVAMLGMIPLGLQVLATAHFPFPANLGLLFCTAGGVVIGAFAAEASARLRREEFEGRRLREDLLRARGDFVAMLTHDLKNPLGVIDGYAEILRESPTLDPETADILRRIQVADRKALLLANNLLDTSRIGDGKLALQRRRVNLQTLLEQSISSQLPMAELEHVTLEGPGSGSLPEIEIDEPLLDRALVNLLNNAIKFSSKGGTVRVSARPADGGVEIDVADTGPGLPPELEGHLFERFAEVSGRRDSSGLGLFIVKSVIDSHGGRVAAANRSDGPGARFTIWLPLTAPGSSPASG